MSCRHALAAFGVAVLAGCGSGEQVARTVTVTQPSVPATTEVPTRAGWVKAADEVCADFNEYVAKQNTRLRAAAEAGDYDKAEDIAQEAADEFDGGTSKLEDLPAPPEDREAIRSFLRAQATRGELLRSSVAAISTRDAAKLNALKGEQERLRERIRGLAQGLGMKDCGEQSNSS